MSYDRAIRALKTDELKEICRKHELTKYSGLGKDGLVQFLMDSLSSDQLEAELKERGLLQESASDAEIQAATNARRKIDDKTYLKHLLLTPTKDDLVAIGKQYYLEGLSKLKKEELVELILDSLSEEELRKLLYEKELEIIKKEIDVALKKINRKERETVENVKIANEERHEVEILFKGFNWEVKSFVSINDKNIDNPDRDCDCKIGSAGGFCAHFWVGVIFSLKQGYFKLSDWTLTKLPDNFEETVRAIQLIGVKSAEQGEEGEGGRKTTIISAGTDEAKLMAFLNLKIEIFEGEVAEVIRKESQFQDAITVYYVATLKNVEFGPARKKDTDPKTVEKVSALKVRLSDKVQNAAKIAPGDTILCAGTLENDNFFGLILKRVMSVSKLSSTSAPSPSPTEIKAPTEVSSAVPNPIASEHPSTASKDEWEVKSASDPSKVYLVKRDSKGLWSCTCPQFAFRRKECKHILEIKSQAN